MPGAGTYIVGQDSPYQTLQQALDQLVTDQGATPFSATQTIVIYPKRNANGTYSYSFEGATVEGLNPTETYRLVIRSGVPQNTSGAPYLYGKKGTGTYAWAGIYVKGVDYVDILDLKIEEFSTGIIFYQSMYGRVISCNLLNNSVMGVQLFEADRCAIVNTTLQNSSALLSIMRSKEAVLVHNLLITGDASSRHCIVAQWENGPVGTATPLDLAIPIYYCYNSAFNCTAGQGTPILLALDVEKTLRKMDGNTYFSTSKAIATIYYTVQGSRIDTLIKTITEWRRITRCEANSIWDPAGIYGTVHERKPDAGVIYEDSAGIFNRGLSLGVVKGNLPSWFDNSILDEDVDGIPRDDTATPTPGPTEISTSPDYDLFADFLLGTSEYEDSAVTSFDRAVSQLQGSVDKWSPNVAAGYFYVGDAAYYLYSSKFARTLHDLTWSKVELPNNMEVQSVGILDTSECDDATSVRWMRKGKTVYANHAGAALSVPITESVRVYGIERSWDSSQQAFIETPLAREFSIKDSEKVFFLDPVPQDGGPVVITDDTLIPDYTSERPDRNDRSILPLEFSTQWNNDIKKTELKLQGYRNIFENPHLYDEVVHAQSGNKVPAGWGFNNVTPNGNHEINYDHQVVGRSYTKVIVPTTYDSTYYAFRQEVKRRNTSADLVFSWYNRTDSGMAYKPVITTYYEDGRTFSEQVLDTINPPLATSDITWERHVVFCRADDDSVFNDYGLPYESLSEANLKTVDGLTSSRVRFELRPAGLGTSSFDAFMAFEGDYLPRYAGLSYGEHITVEYDSSDAGMYNVSDLVLSPIVNPQHTGFLVIGPVQISDLDTSVLETYHTTLSDTHKPSRTDLLPWAKIDGPNKLRGVSSNEYGLIGHGLPREVGFTPALPTAKTIDVTPNPIHVTQGLKKSFHVSVVDSTNNPYAHKDVSIELDEANDHYVGSLGIMEMGGPSKLGTNFTVKSDPSGSLVATIIAPDKRYIAESFGTSELYPSNKVPTYYEPNIENHANVTIVRTATGQRVSTHGQFTSEVLTPTEEGRELVLALSEIPVFSTVDVKVRGTSEYDVTLHESLNRSYHANEFYVDYATGAVYYKNSRTGNARVSYVPNFAWVNTSDPNAVQIHPDLVDILTSDYIMQYDAKAELVIQSGGRSLRVPVVLLNPDI